MCGIVGLISRRQAGFFSPDMEIMENMLLIDQLRGKDSTGAFSVYKNKQSEIVKIASHPSHLFACKAWGDFRNRVIQRGRLVIGHNRKATVGKVKTENAHPFVEDNIILVHNGSLWDEGKGLTSKKVEVDSNAIAHALSGGADPKEVIPTIKGAFALIWYDTAQEKLFAIRNDQRPLHLLTTDDNYVLSSEPLIAALALDRNNKNIQDMIPIEPGDLYEFGDMGKFTVSKVDLSKKAYGQTDSTSRTGQSTMGGNDNKYSRATHQTSRGSWEEMDEDPVIDTGGNTAPFVMGSTDNPQNRIKNLREKLTEAAQKKQTTQASNVCALTQKKDGVTRSDGTLASGLTSVETIHKVDEIAFNNTKTIQVEHPTLRRNQKVLFKVQEIFKTEDRWRFRGKVMQPGESLLDCVGYCPETWRPETIGMEFVGKFAVGFVHFVTSTNGGLSVFIRNMDKPQYTQVHKNKVPFLQWQHALAFCKCVKCGQRAKAWDKNFTSVSAVSIIESGGTNTRNVVKMMCADCVQQVLPENEREEFVKGREQIAKSIQQRASETVEKNQTANTGGDNPVQDREPISKESGSKVGGSIIVPGTQTLQ